MFFSQSTWSVLRLWNPTLFADNLTLMYFYSHQYSAEFASEISDRFSQKRNSCGATKPEYNTKRKFGRCVPFCTLLGWIVFWAASYGLLSLHKLSKGSFHMGTAVRNPKRLDSKQFQRKPSARGCLSGLLCWKDQTPYGVSVRWLQHKDLVTTWEQHNVITCQDNYFLYSFSFTTKPWFFRLRCWKRSCWSLWLSMPLEIGIRIPPPPPKKKKKKKRFLASSCKSQENVICWKMRHQNLTHSTVSVVMAMWPKAWRTAFFLCFPQFHKPTKLAQTKLPRVVQFLRSCKFCCSFL